MKSKIKIGILVDELKLQRWQINALLELQQVADFSALYIILPKNSIAFSDSSPLLYRFYRNRFLRIKSQEKTDFPAFTANQTVLRVNLFHSDKRNRLSEEDLRRIKDLDLDVMIRFGMGILDGEILQSSRLGIWSYHHGDPEFYRGGPPGFWEMKNNDPLTGFMVQQLTPQLDMGKVLYKGYVKTTFHHYGEQWDNLLRASEVGLKNAYLRSVDSKITLESPGRKGIFYSFPGTLPLISFLGNMWMSRIRLMVEKRFKREYWSIGFGKLDWQGVEPRIDEIHWLQSKDSDKYLADPFLFAGAKGLSVLAEEYSYRTRSAKIVAMDPATGSTGTPTEILADRKHLSFPAVFTEDKRVILIAESSGEHRVEARIIHGLDEIAQPVTLLEEPLFDTVMHRDGVYYWLLGSKKLGNTDALYLYFANDWNGPYTAHPGNPVVQHPAYARNAGNLFMKNNRWIRPAQNGVETYGAFVSFMEVIRLSPTEYEERHIQNLKPQRHWSHSEGLHTFNFLGDYAVIDAKKHVWKW
ncbi:MAG TPA: hypothetical protein VFV37_05935 [Luteibaculaceae bacterium]|nr:hypothetical protein [Luteibaculaceae bacterium]